MCEKVMKKTLDVLAMVLTTVTCVGTLSANAIDSISVNDVSVSIGQAAPAFPALVSMPFTASLSAEEIGLASTNYVVKWKIANIVSMPIRTCSTQWGRTRFGIHFQPRVPTSSMSMCEVGTCGRMAI